MAVHTRPELRGQHVTYPHGAVAGLIGGIAMAMVTMMVTAMMGMGAFAMPQMIGGLLLGPGAAMSGGAGVVMIGLMLHMMFSIVFGLIYAAIVNSATHEFWVTGIVFGIVLWLFNFYVVGLFLPGARAMQSEPLWLAVMNHMVFGLVTAWVAKALASRSVAA